MTASEILKQFNTAEIKEKMAEFPGRIQAAKGFLNVMRETLKDAEQELKEAEAMLATKIALETNGNGKPKFSNEKMWQAELVKRQKTDENYREALKNLREAQRAHDNAQLNLDRVYDEFRTMRYIARLTEAELRIISRGF